jgi:hypothetical protein
MNNNDLRRSVQRTPSEVVFPESVPSGNLALKGAQPRV